MPASSPGLIMHDPGKRSRSWRWIPITAALLGGIVLLVWSRTHRPPPPTVNAPLTVTVAAVGSTTVSAWISLIGSVQPRDTAVVAAESAGRVVELPVELGDRVTRGQVLARLDGELVAAQVAQNEAEAARAFANQRQAEAQVAEAEAAFAEAQRALRRAEILDASGNASGETLDARRTQLAQALARVASAKSAIAQAAADQARNQAQRRELSQLEARLDLRAPADGLVVERLARLGAVPGPGEPLLRIAIAGAMEIAAEIPEDRLPRIANGQSAELLLAGMTEPISGTVRRIDPQVDALTRLGAVRITTDHPLAATATGTSVRIRIRLASEHGLAVPASALITHAGTPAVVVIDGAGTAAIRPVQTGIGDGLRILIAAGLSAGERVVVRAPGFVPPGTAVQAVDTPLAEAPPWP